MKRASSRSMWSTPVMSAMLTTSTSLPSCWLIWWMTSSDPTVTSVRRETVSSSVGATLRLSML